MTIGWHFDNTYSKLSNTFKEEVKPTPVHNPELVVLNDQLAKDLKLDFSKVEKKDLSQIFSGNTLPKGSTTIAQAYAGHQFGHFTMLGDGRAVLLGEHLVNNTNRFDVQFKGSGRTSFSRNGDGRAVLGPMLREYIISEVIHALKKKDYKVKLILDNNSRIKKKRSLNLDIVTPKIFFKRLKDRNNLLIIICNQSKEDVLNICNQLKKFEINKNQITHINFRNLDKRYV